ncbi:formate dehydrogenase accessory sulfurtransferase FdhD [Nakamurella sp. YIM 132087]|uniref:Sulfur carrier protein FdhD n=1 Tax=Nakamurella alba TaxID=2665158 RepID=A0A7K1FKU5_9ACTN|nr:formate dehydrogenase accessory sulfurtransferase FdhD [Nakamurella alba]MTD13494.1 formate dehydrogenase accessory sulfurtransferase FdhD [Nakamurella alba]
MSRVIARAKVRHWNGTGFVSRPDSVAGEEPLEIRVAGAPFTVTMRTPGHDIELAHGLLHAEGIVAGRADVTVMRYCDGVDEQGRNTYNVLDVALSPTAADPAAVAAAARSLTTTSACGVCGSASIDALAKRQRYPLPVDGPVFDPAVLARLPELLRPRQQGFRTTGGLHAAALATTDGRLEFVREDVGRHNAVDKVIGAAMLEGRLPLGDRALLTSSRASFELVQKAVLAGIPVLVAVSAPSSLAVELAESTGLTLVGFTRHDGFNLYTGHHRVRGA